MDGDNDIYLASSTGTTLTKLTKNSTEEINAAWSPDGQYIAFSSVRNKPTDTEQVFVMRVGGSDVRQITSDPTRSRRAVAWSPTNRILIATFEAPDFLSDLRSIQSDGTNEIALISTPNVADYAGPGAAR
jgi:Tol biopolymer transport system component